MCQFGELRDSNDPNLTYEGDNNVLLQQTANYLLRLLQDRMSGEDIILDQSFAHECGGCHTPPAHSGGRVSSPLGTVDFIDRYDSILKRRYAPASSTTRMTLEGKGGHLRTPLQQWPSCQPVQHVSVLCCRCSGRVRVVGVLPAGAEPQQVGEAVF